ncbi:MAG: MurR/RpiR family transcriptional regulator [Actinobacteria bacterium]|nr:MurR/RpiR family transcriptional regulator [Actinomycetota bacterium]
MRQGSTERDSGSRADRILKAHDGLTPSERRVGQAILASYPGSGLRSGSAIAEASETSPATVVRFVAKLGFDGMSAFHSALRDEIDERLRSPFELSVPPRSSDGLLANILDSHLRIVSESVRRLSVETVERVAGLLLESARVSIMGGRFSQAVAHYLYAHLQMLRPDVRLVGPWPAPIADQLAYCGRRDCLVVFDFRRYQGDAAFAAEFVKKRRGRVVVVTDPYLSPAAQSADYTLIASVEGVALADSYAGAVALVDAIVSHVLVAEEQEMAKRIAMVEEARAEMTRAAAEEYEGPLAEGSRARPLL